jgi:hypothetical protein
MNKYLISNNKKTGKKKDENIVLVAIDFRQQREVIIE